MKIIVVRKLKRINRKLHVMIKLKKKIYFGVCSLKKAELSKDLYLDFYFFTHHSYLFIIYSYCFILLNLFYIFVAINAH